MFLNILKDYECGFLYEGIFVLLLVSEMSSSLLQLFFLLRDIYETNTNTQCDTGSALYVVNRRSSLDYKA